MSLSNEGRSNAIAKLEGIITKGRESALTVINHVMTNQPQDALAKASALGFTADHTAKAVRMQFPTVDQRHDVRIHRHALGQVAQFVDMPMKFVDSLQDEKSDWGRELLAHNLNTIFHERGGKDRRLVRTINGEVRGFLSDTYRRLDSRPIVEAFAMAVQAKGAQPYAGHVTDTKIAIQAIFPHVFEPVPGEMAAYGLSLENSDFGNGALSVRAYLLRIWCNNMALTEETMRQIHLGKRLEDNLIYSQRTYQLDSDTTVSALKDVINLQLDHKALETRIDQLKVAAGTAVTIEAARTQLKKVLNKGEAEEAIRVFESNDEYNLPAGNTAWRMSNAISWIANASDVSTERKLELNRIAGDVLPKAA
jgi:hypothetical protein